MKKLYYLIILTVILGLVLTGCFLSNVGQVPTTEQSGITYLTKGGSTVVTLFAGKDEDVGTVTVSDDGNNLTVTYNTTSPWEMTETHLYVGKTDPESLTSAPGQFPYSEPHSPITSKTYIIALSDISFYELGKGKKWVAIGIPGIEPGDSIFIAAHAEVISTELTETAIELTNWGRSTESEEDGHDVPYSIDRGGAVEEGFGLPIVSGLTVWNKGLYYEDNDGIVNPLPDIDFVTWNQWLDVPYDSYEVRHFQAYFDLPKEIKPENVEQFILFSPYCTSEDIIPINDNIYVRLNGQGIGWKGTSPGGGGSKKTSSLYETDGWYVEGDFIGAPEFLEDDNNVINFVTEEYYWWGGMHRLDLKLVWYKEEKETAWGDGIQIRKDKNWAMYFLYPYTSEPE